MMERLDVAYKTCVSCKGSRKDPRKRTRPCVACLGSGTSSYCTNCGDDMPCMGTKPDVMDQTHCILPCLCHDNYLCPLHEGTKVTTILSISPIVVTEEELEGPRPSLMKRVFDDAIASMAVRSKQSQDALLASIVDRNEKLEKAVQIYAMHYALSEGIDRSYPHSRGKYNAAGRFQVQPRMGHTKSADHISKLRELITRREEMIRLLDLEPSELKAARYRASSIADGALDECQCSECYAGP